MVENLEKEEEAKIGWEDDDGQNDKKRWPMQRRIASELIWKATINLAYKLVERAPRACECRPIYLSAGRLVISARGSLASGRRMSISKTCLAWPNQVLLRNHRHPLLFRFMPSYFHGFKPSRWPAATRRGN